MLIPDWSLENHVSRSRDEMGKRQVEGIFSRGAFFWQVSVMERMRCFRCCFTEIFLAWGRVETLGRGESNLREKRETVSEVTERVFISAGVEILEKKKEIGDERLLKESLYRRNRGRGLYLVLNQATFAQMRSFRFN